MRPATLNLPDDPAEKTTAGKAGPGEFDRLNDRRDMSLPTVIAGAMHRVQTLPEGMPIPEKLRRAEVHRLGL